MTMFFLLVILGATDKRAPAGFAPIAIGLALTLIHLISIPVANTSVNPARSTGVALFVGDWAIAQLWLFWLAPILGALLGALVYRLIGSEDHAPEQIAQLYARRRPLSAADSLSLAREFTRIRDSCGPVRRLEQGRVLGATIDCYDSSSFIGAVKQDMSGRVAD